MKDDNEIDEEAIVDGMVEWFFANFEDPVHSMPWNEGEYVWLVSAHYAHDELQDHFDGQPEHLIDAAVELIEQDGWQWVSVEELKHIRD